MNLIRMHGTGNVFFVLDGFRAALPRADELPALARAVCETRVGDGADGLLTLQPSHGVAGRMRVYNADGSIAEMCGNGLRCVAKLLHDRYDVDESFTVVTDAGPRQVEILSASTESSEVRIDLGRPIFEPERIPTKLRGTPPIEQPVAVEQITWLFTCVSMGNPHAVTFVNDPDTVDVPRIGPAIEKHEAFPNRTNVEFAAVLSPTQIRLRVWERGVGETAACGTGAAATAIAAILTGRTQREVTIQLPGGELQVSWPHDEAEVSLAGPASLLGVVEWNERGTS